MKYRHRRHDHSWKRASQREWGQKDEVRAGEREEAGKRSEHFLEEFLVFVLAREPFVE